MNCLFSLILLFPFSFKSTSGNLLPHHSFETAFASYQWCLLDILLVLRVHFDSFNYSHYLDRFPYLLLGFQNISLFCIVFYLTGFSSLLIAFRVLYLWNLEQPSAHFSDCLFSFTQLVISFSLMVLKYNIHVKVS